MITFSPQKAKKIRISSALNIRSLQHFGVLGGKEEKFFYYNVAVQTFQKARFL